MTRYAVYIRGNRENVTVYRLTGEDQGVAQFSTFENDVMAQRREPGAIAPKYQWESDGRGQHRNDYDEDDLPDWVMVLWAQHKLMGNDA